MTAQRPPAPVEHRTPTDGGGRVPLYCPSCGTRLRLADNDDESHTWFENDDDDPDDEET